MENCPLCRTGLAPVETPGGAALGCRRCAHVWLDPDGFETLQAAVERRYTPDDLHALRAECAARKRAALERPVVYRDCPGCGRQMLRRTFGQGSFLLVHYCAGHGFWVHKDDLAAIVAYIARGGELLETARTAEELARRVRRLESDNRQLRRRTESTGGFIPLGLPF